MMVLQISKSLLVVLLLLGQALSHSKHTPKLNAKPPPARKQKGRPSVATVEDVHQVVPPSGESAEPQARSALVTSKPSSDMKLAFLRNTKVTCNDGTTAGYYIREQKNSKRWIVFLEGTGILSAHVDENPHWWSANAVFVPYCSSDIWIGTLPKSRQAPYAFMGSLIIQEVIKDLIPKGIKQAKVLLLAGSSAGATGVLLNIDRVAALLAELEADALQVQGLVDSGWFLIDTKRPKPAGVSRSFGLLSSRCTQERAPNMESPAASDSQSTPVFVVQWLFDEEQLKLENVHLGSTSILENQRGYIQNLGRELKSSLRDIPAVFVPSCLAHTLVIKSYWTEIQVRGVPLPRALQCWGKSLHDAGQPSRPPLRGCPFRLIDSCLWPHCNPTCPALPDPAGDQEA
ncbi:UNVERIFIED_CONTAM: hypothetical protein K2H54_025174 [Gekko kuhli]